MPCGNSIPQKVPFESYAVIRIKGAIIDEVRKHAKISRYKMAAVNQFYQARQELEQSLKREATDTEICKQLGINQSQLADIYESLHYLASVSLEDTLFAYQEEGMTIKDMVRDPAENVEDTLVAEENAPLWLRASKIRGTGTNNFKSVLYRRTDVKRNR